MTDPTTNVGITRLSPPRRSFAFEISGTEERRRRKAMIDGIHVRDDVFRSAEMIFDRLVLACNDRTPTFALVIRAPTGAGKSHILDHLKADPRLAPYEDEYGLVTPMVYVEAPSPCTLKTLGLSIYASLTGEILVGRTQEHDIWQRVRSKLVNMGVSILMIDELHHAFEGRNVDERKKLVSTLKALILGRESADTVKSLGALPPTIKTMRMGLVLAGMPHLKDLIAEDDQLKRRCRFRTILPTGRSNLEQDRMKDFITAFYNALGMKTTPSLLTADMMLRLRRAGGHYRGRIAYLIKEAAYLAINEDASTLDCKKHLAVIFEEIFEVGTARNPFLIPNIKNLGRLEEVERDMLTLLRGESTNPSLEQQ